MGAEEFAALGRLLVAATTLEAICYDMARSLGVRDPEKLSAKAALKATRRALTARGVPPWSSADPSEILAWTHEADPLIDRRNEIAHSVTAEQKQDDGWVLIRRHVASGAVEVFSVDDIKSLAESCYDCAGSGSALQAQLMHSPREGVFVWHPPFMRPDQSWVQVHWVVAKREWPARPTPEELDEWWASIKAKWGPPDDSEGV